MKENFVFCMSHYHGETEEVYGDEKLLGYFSIVALAEEAKQNYLTLPGFPLYPNGFAIIPTEVKGERRSPIVWRATAEVRDAEYDFDTVIDIGVYWQKELAEAAMEEFCRINTNFGKDELIVEYEIESFQLDECLWTEGFTF